MSEMLSRWNKYRARYGALHSAVRFAGSNAPIIWHAFGPIVSAKYRENWLKSSDRKVINLGGGSHISDDFLTVDVDPRADCYVDLTKPLPFEDSSIDAVFCEEAIEHLSKADGLAMLIECARIMKPGAKIRITTPDLDWFAAQFLNRSISCDLINDIFFNHAHKYIYSRQELSYALTAASFVSIQASGYKDANSALGLLDSHPERFNHVPEISQYVEAQKPELIC